MASNPDVENNNVQGLLSGAQSGPFGSAFKPRGVTAQPVEDEAGRFGASADQMQYLLGASLEYLSEGIGADNLSAYWGSVRSKNQAELEQYDRITFENARGKGNDLSKYFLDLLVIDGATLITTALAAIGTTALTGGGTLAALSGAGIASFVLNAGDTFAESVDAVGKENVDKGLVLGASLLMAGLDAALPGKIGGAIVSKGIREKVKASAAENLAKNKWWSRAVKVGLQSSLTEAGTEGMQEVLQAATINAQEGKDPFDFSAEQIAEFQEAAWAGGFLGGGAGVVTSGVGRKSARKIIGRKEEAVAQLDSELESNIAKLEAERTSLAEQGRTFEVRKRSNDITKEISNLKTEANKKKTKIWGADSEAAINKIVPIKEQEAEAETETETEAAPEKEKTLAQIMAEDTRTSPRTSTQSPTLEEIQAKIEQESSGPTQADVMPDVMPGTPAAPRPGTITDEVAARADQGLAQEEFDPSAASKTPVSPREGTETANIVAAEAAARAEKGLQEESLQDPDQTVTIPEGRPRRSFAAIRAAREAASQGPQATNRPVINTVIGDGENVLLDGDILITAADIEEAKFVKASRELEDIAMQAESDAFEQAEADGMDYPEALAAGNEARERALQEGGERRTRVYSSKDSRLQAQREAAEQRQKRADDLTARAKARVAEDEKLEAKETAKSKEIAKMMAVDFMEWFEDTNATVEEMQSRRNEDIAHLSTRVGPESAINEYRKNASRDRINKILEARAVVGGGTEAQVGEITDPKPPKKETTQKKAAKKPDEKAPPKGGVGSSGQPTNREGKTVDPKADAAPTQADVAPTVGDTQAKVPDISNVVIKDTDPIILEENKRIRELEKKREAIDDALEAGSPELSDLVNGKNLEHEKLLLEEMELRINQRERGLRKRGIDLESSRTDDPSNPRNPLPDFIRDRDKAKKNIEALEAGVDPVTVPGTTMNPDGNKTPTQADVAPPVDEAILEDTDTAKRDKGKAEKDAPKEEEAKPDDTTTKDSKGAREQENVAPKEVEPDIAVTDADEDQTQDQQIAEMRAREQASVDREVEDEQADAEFQAGTDDTGPVVEDVDEGVNIPVVDTTAVTPDITQADLVEDTVVGVEDTSETVIPEATTTGINLDKYESIVSNPQGVEAIVYEDPENPDSFIVESEGVVINREDNKQNAVLYADKMSKFVANREKKKARNAFVPRPEGKTYDGKFLKGLGRGTRALLAGTGKTGDSFRLSLDKNKRNIADNNDIPYDDTTTEEDLYDALYAKYIAPKEEAAPTEVVETEDASGEVQEKAERIVAADYDMFGNKINRTYPETIDEYSSDEQVDASIAAREARENFAETDDPSDLIELGWDDADAEIRAQELAEAKERAQRTAKNRALKLTPEYWTEILDTNTALKDISKTKSQGGFEISELRAIANNILKADPSFEYNPAIVGERFKKGTRKDIEAAIKSYIIKDVEPVESNSPYVDTVDDDTGTISTEYKESRIDPDSIDQAPFKPGEVLLSKDEVELSIKQELKKIFGVRSANEMLDVGFVNILSIKQAAKESGESKRSFKNTSAYVHLGNAEVVFLPENIVKTNATSDTIRGLIWHEIGAHVGRSMLSSNEFSSIIKEVRRLHKKGDIYAIAAFDAVARNYKNLYKDFAKPLSTELQLGDRVIYGFKTKNGKNPVNVIGQDNIFWEEVLAHMLEYKGQELDLQRSSLMKRVKDAFKKFFIRVFQAYEVDSIPDVTVDDIFNTMAGVVIERLPPLIQRAKLDYASRDYASKAVQDGFLAGPAREGFLDDAQTKARNRFIEDSLVNEEVYHGSDKNWSAPILEFTEMGLHVGTMAAALQRVNGDLGKLTQGYIKVTNPFLGADDIGHWAGPEKWTSELNRMMKDGDISDKDYQALFPVANKWANRLDPVEDSREIYDGLVKFSSEYRDTLKSLGYDSIQYVNKHEDTKSTSYILLSEDQFKAASSFTFTSGVNAIKDAKIAAESPSKNLPIMRKIDGASKEQAFDTRNAQGKILKTSKFLQRLIEPLMTLSGYSELETHRMLTKGEIGKWHNQGRIIFDVIYQATPEEKKKILKYFETRDASPDALPARKVPVAKLPTILRGTKAKGRMSEDRSIKDVVINSKKQIEKLGADLVAAGLITQEQYDRLKGEYLPKTYFNNLAGDIIPMGIGTSKMNYTKVRSAHENFLKDVVEGRIKDPAFLAGRYISMAGADLATINYLSFLAADTGKNGWVLPNQIVKYENMEGTIGFWSEKIVAMRNNAVTERGLKNIESAKTMEKTADAIQREVDKVAGKKLVVNTKEYKMVPNNPRYGAMRGLYVKKEIVNDVIGTDSLYTNNEVLNSLLSFGYKGTKVFKYTKVPMNIPTQARNIISNVVLMDVSGTNFLKIPGLIGRAISDIVSDGKYAQLARKYGIESTTFSSEELVKMDAQLNKLKSEDDGWSGMWAKSKIFFNDYVDVFGRTYQKTEIMFKVAKMIDLMENKGKSEAEAARLANEALLDYSNVSQGVRVIRSLPLGSPFITFNLKAGAQMIRNIKNHPIAVAKYIALPYVVSQMLLENNDDIEEDDIPALKKLMADYMEKNATSMILPWKDEEGRLRVFDMGYFLPWGAHMNMMKNLYQGEFGEASRVPGFFGGWLGAVTGMQTNVDPFTKQEITNDADPPFQQFQDMSAFLLSYMVPPMFMPRNKSGDVIGNGGQLIKTGMAYGFIDGNIDKDGLPKTSIPESWLSWSGVNFSKLDENTSKRKIKFKAREIQATIGRLKKFLKDPNLNEQQRQRLISEYRANILRIQTELQELTDAYSQVKDVL